MFENKMTKQKVIKNEVQLKVFKNEALERIIVEFSDTNGKFKVQKSFQDNYEGKLESESFQKTIGSLKDLKKYFGIK